MSAQRKSARGGSGGGAAQKADLNASIHLVFGGDEFLVSENTKKLVEKLCPPAEQDFGLETVDGACDNAAEAIAAIRACIGGLQTLGFLSGRKVVWLKDASFFGGSEAKDTKEEIERFVSIIKAGLPAGQILVVSAPKVDKRSAFYKACQAAGSVLEYDVPAKGYQAEARARDIADKALRKAGLRASEEALEEFLVRAGTDTRQIVNEVEKLSVYLRDRETVRLEDVENVVSSSREAIAWDLADAVGTRDLPRALRLLRQLLFQGENEIGLMFGIEGRFRDILFYRECMERGWLRVSGSGRYTSVDWESSPEVDEVMSVFDKDPRKTHPFRLARLVEQARNFGTREAARCQALVLETHRKMFSSGLPKELLLEFLLLRLLGGGSRKAPGPSSGR